MAVTPQVAAIAEQMAAAFGGPMTTLPIEQLRAATVASIPASGIEVGQVQELTVGHGGRQVPIRVYRPADVAEPDGVLLWLHGGGFALGGLELGDDLSRRLCNATGLAVVNVDYAVAPERPFPAGLHDCLAVLGWIRGAPSELDGCATSRVVVAGDSAGGNLAMVLSQLCRDQGLPAPACQVSVYGTAECTITNPELADLPFLTAADAEWFWSAYTDTPEDPYVSPALAEDLTALPPLFVVTAEHDPTRDGSERYAAALAAHGGVAVHRRYPGMHHGFFGMVDLLPEAQQAFDDVVAFIDAQLRRTP
ncbi:alpha/beta hydrolase [Nocardioides dubius]|uniref:Alpha/beta hydrolase n=1 Tax=Nocardioides dubius TaxID=317019 RepID=A0ABP4EHT0_9ACTN